MDRELEEITAFMFEQDLRKLLPDFAVEHLETVLALEATADDAGSLMFATPNDLRSHVVVLLFYRRAPLPVFRAALSSCWDHDHNELLPLGRRLLRSMFKRAAFDLPPELPDTIKLWRGTSHFSAHRAAYGLSWTTSRAVACWFATHYRGDYPYRRGAGSRPLVLAVDIPKESALLWCNDRSEAEIVCFDAARYRPRLDGDAADWRQVGAALQAQRNAERAINSAV